MEQVELGAIPVVRISTRIVSSVNSLRINWLSERFYTDADGIRISFGKKGDNKILTGRFSQLLPKC